MLSTWLCGARLIPRRQAGRSLHITGASQRLEPLEDGAVVSPSCDSRSDMANRSCLRDRGALRLEVDGSVSIRGLDAGVTEPVTDRDEVDPGLEEVDRGRVADNVGWTRFAARVFTTAVARPVYLRRR